MNKRIICIAGPTASGKTGFSLRLARRFGGAVINADSMQVYKDLYILSARPSADEISVCPHHMFGHVDGRERYNAARWLNDAIDVIEGIDEEIIYIVGGTGLYFSVLTQGLAKIPEIDPEIRHGIENRISEEGASALYDEAVRADPVAMQKISENDTTRITRVLEVFLSTNRTISEWQHNTAPYLPPSQWRGVVLMPPREDLYARINTRFEHMLESGALDEVGALLARGLNPGLPVMKALGVPQIIEHLQGDISLEEVVRQGAQDTRRFAKRQMTWFRNRSKDWSFANNIAAIDDLEQKITKFLD